MKTITFYSYKGGVGRTLSLIKIADLLTQFGRKVCIVDFDLEAPGIHYKYKGLLPDTIDKGLVDYIYEFSVNTTLPATVKEYAIELKQNKEERNTIFIPAGNTKSGDYWKKLSHISWWNLFYKKESEGIPFFIDFKEKIKKEFSPDYLLIDTRTGITEISAITMTILADSIALFAVNNDENICGTEHIIKAITNKENNLLGLKRNIHFVLSRIPFPRNPEERSREEEIKNLIEDKIKDAFSGSNETLKSFNLIHSYREVELSEKANLYYSFKKKHIDQDMMASMMPEYISLFDNLVIQDFTPEEEEEFNKYKQATTLLKGAYDSFEINFFDTLKKLDEVDALVQDLPETHFLRGSYYYEMKEYKKANSSFIKGEKTDDTGRCLFFSAQSYYKLKKYTDALKKLEKYKQERHSEYRPNAYRDALIIKEFLNRDRDALIKEATELIEKYPYNGHFYNIRSCLLLRERQYEKALEDINKAIDLEENPVFLLTLAEIKYCQEDYMEFYRNLDRALKQGYNIDDILTEDTFTKNIYFKILDDDEFERVLARHNKLYFLELLKQHKENMNQTDYNTEK